MRKLHLIASMLIATGAITLSGCIKEKGNVTPTETTTPTEETKKNVRLDIKGLEYLGVDYKYEGWLIVDGKPVSAGVFTIDANGDMTQTEFEMAADDVEKATSYVLTIEPDPDFDRNPSKVHLLGGDFIGNTASLNTAHKAALGADLTTATGGYILATPTDKDTTNEQSGIWWLDPTKGPGPSLGLPKLPDGWKYEGWVVINGQPVSTGTFTAVVGSDDAAPYSGTMDGPKFPGEDFLNNAPAGLTFPVNLSGSLAVISIEPYPDNSTAPFFLKPLWSGIADSAETHKYYGMNNNAAASSPTGTVSR